MNEAQKNILVHFSGTIHFLKFYIFHFKKFENEGLIFGKQKDIVRCYFSLIHTSVINSLYIYLAILVDKEENSENWKTISIFQILKDYLDFGITEEIKDKYLGILQKKEVLIQNIKNKRNKIVVHYDKNIAQNYNESDYISDNYTPLNDIEELVTTFENFLNDIGFADERKNSFDQILKFSNPFIDNFLKKDILSNSVKIHNSLI